MSTRHAPDGAPLADNRYMSDPAFVEMRGISGTTVAAKAEFISEKSKRALLFFIQSLSIERDGTKRMAREIVERFPDRIGTPSMLKFGMKPGQICNSRQVKIVRAELERESCANGVPDDAMERLFEKTDYSGEWPLKGEFVPAELSPRFARWSGFEHTPAEKEQAIRELDEENRERRAKAEEHPASYPAAGFVEQCRKSVMTALLQWLRELCINPRIELRGGSVREGVRDIDREELMEANPQLNPMEFEAAAVRYFSDILGALTEFKRRHEESARQAFAMTSIGKAVFKALDYELKVRRMVLIQGDSGVDKSESVKARCDQHRGEARYVRLSGINGRRAFFGEVAKACGVRATAGLSPEKIQARVENFLETTGLMLVIDEGQYLWPQGGRVRRHPELINWLDTACAYESIPVAIVVTEEFTRQRRTVEDLTTWNSEQFRRPLRRIFPLPGKPTKADLLLVAQKLLPGGTKPMLDYVAGYALASGGCRQAVVDAIDDARIIAEAAGRDRITVADLKRAIGEWRAPADAAQQRVFAPGEKRGKGRRNPTSESPSADVTPHRGSATAEPPPQDGEATDFAGRGSAPPQTEQAVSPRATRPGLAVA